MMSNFEIFKMLAGVVVILVVSIGGFIAIFCWLMSRLDHGWHRKHTYQVIGFFVSIALMVGTTKAASAWYRHAKAFEIAHILASTKVQFQGISSSTTRGKPGSLWFGGSFAPGGFEHGTAWCTGYETEYQKIFTFALENPAVVYVDVYDDDVLDAVYASHIEKNRFPSIPRHQVPRKPTPEQKEHYAVLIQKLRKPALAKAIEREYGSMFPR